MVWLLLLGLLATLPVGAKKLYKYVDENGILHYTDREPDTEQLVEVNPGRHRVVKGQLKLVFFPR